MLKLNDCIKDLEEYRNKYGSSLGINRIGIFGSVARGDNTEDSDIDIVVDVENPSFKSISEIRDQLQHLFGCNVDLVRYRRSLRPRLKQNIDKETIYV